MTENEEVHPSDVSEGEMIADIASEETEEKKAVTRSIHISTPYVVITITTQDEKEDINQIRKIAEELMDKYIRFQDIQRKEG